MRTKFALAVRRVSMRVSPHFAICLGVLAVLFAPAVSAQRPAPPTAPHRPTIAQYLKPGLPIELVSAKKADRIAWIAYEEGKRNVFTAAPPLFQPVRITAFLKDDGVDLTGLKISDDGSTVVFFRGSAPNAQGWVANPGGDPAGGERAIWAAKVATPGIAWRLAEGGATEVAPDGSSVLYAKEGQIYRAKVGPGPALTPIDKGDTPFIKAQGLNSAPGRWSPDGANIAFSSNRTNHSLIALYNTRTKLVTYIAPSVDRDTSPTFSPDGKKIAFLRRPGLPFGAQATPGIVNPNVGGALAAALAAQNVTGGPQGGRGGRGVGTGTVVLFGGAPLPAALNPAAPPPAVSPLANSPGLYGATLPGGHALAIMIADIATGETSEVWHSSANEPFANINAIQWIGDSFIFTTPAQGNEEGPRYYSLNVSAATAPVRLNTTEGIVENATAATFSKDGKTFYYCTNAGDIDRRHIWSVPVSGGTPTQVTTGEGIENVPVVLASGKQIAVMSADARRPMGIGIWPATTSPASAQKVIYPTLASDFPIDAEVVPTNVTLRAEGGLEFHNQLFLPKDIKPGEKRPALIFVHGGPQRQMLLGWHYLNFYHVFYGVNQWLVSQGYIVMSVNYRLGIGYGVQFRQAGALGSPPSDVAYKDVLAAGKWLAAREDVDPSRVGIWGLSYGGRLTALALARNSDIFKVGVDLAGIHLEGPLDPESPQYRASAIADIDTWKSPVLLVHGDDDRNVNFAQTVGLVQLLRARNIPHELVVLPDDVHETLLHSRWLYTFDRMERFLNKYLLGENGR